MDARNRHLEAGTILKACKFRRIEVSYDGIGSMKWSARLGLSGIDSC